MRQIPIYKIEGIFEKTGPSEAKDRLFDEQPHIANYLRKLCENISKEAKIHRGPRPDLTSMVFGGTAVYAVMSDELESAATRDKLTNLSADMLDLLKEFVKQLENGSERIDYALEQAKELISKAESL